MEQFKLIKNNFMKFKYGIYEQTTTTELESPDLGQVHKECNRAKHVARAQSQHMLVISEYSLTEGDDNDNDYMMWFVCNIW